MIGTVASWMRDAAAALKDAGADSPGRDAQMILIKVLGIDELQLISNALRVLRPDEQLQANSLLSRRLEGEPIAYIVGYKDFYGIKFYTDKRALIPRAETETIAEWVIKNIKGKKKLIDIGTGAGTLAITIKKHLPQVSVTATDISSDALKLAKINADEQDVTVKFIESNLLDGVETQFEVIVANLPYLRNGQIVSKEVAAEPSIALYAADDGMALYNKLFKQVSKLKNQPTMVIEHDILQDLDITKLARTYSFDHQKLSEFVSLLTPKE